MKNKLCLLLLSLLCIANISHAHNDKIIYQFDIRSEINSKAWIYTQQALREAKDIDASLVVLCLNTYGGEVVYADSIRTAILQFDIPIVAFIDNNAASAGALISIACDRIYMKSGSMIGASTVVSGASGEKAPDKYQSYMRATMRSTAESHGIDSTTGKWLRDPAIAEAMVDENNSIVNGKILTFTASEAINNNYCEAIVENIDEIIALENIDPELVTFKIYKPSAIDSIKGTLLGTALRSMLIMLIFGGIFYEIKTPGLGLPIIVAIVAAFLYFAPLFIDGLASVWEIIIFVTGLMLILAEIFLIPGFGVAGISGIILSILGLTFSLINNDIRFDFENFEFINISWNAIGEAAFTVFFGIISSSILIIYLSSRIGSGGIFSKLSLETTQNIEDGYVSVDLEQSDLIGRQAIVTSDLRPSGKIEIDGKRYDAISQMKYISKGTTVTVKRMRNGNVYVE